MIKNETSKFLKVSNKIIIIFYINLLPLLPSSLPMKYPITIPIRNIPEISIKLNISPDEIIISIINIPPMFLNSLSLLPKFQ